MKEMAALTTGGVCLLSRQRGGGGWPAKTEGRQGKREVKRYKWRMDSEAGVVVEGERNTKQKGAGTGGCCFNRRVPSISDQSLLSAFGASPPSASHSC